MELMRYPSVKFNYLCNYQSLKRILDLEKETILLQCLLGEGRVKSSIILPTSFIVTCQFKFSAFPLVIFMLLNSSMPSFSS